MADDPPGDRAATGPETAPGTVAAGRDEVTAAADPVVPGTLVGLPVPAPRRAGSLVPLSLTTFLG